MLCPACGSRDIDFHEANGHSYCVSCGTVVEENAIVSSIEFQEAGDRSHVIGQFVSQNCAQPFSASSRTRGRFGTSNSREQTLANIRRIISQVAGSLHLPPLYIDRAYRLYQLALQKNFVFGRRQMHVVATCLYVICRQEKSPHLLIDFSDALQVNVFVLGKSYLQFIRLLSLKLPIVDPSLYIHRFAQRLELGPKINQVATTALRIVTRMKKDWIILGRRPDGICAAAMLVSCRAHGFPKAQGDIAKIFRVSGDTLRRRLDDFMATPSAQLTVEQFHFNDSLVEFDPPAFIRNKLKESSAAAEAANAPDGSGNSSSAVAASQNIDEEDGYEDFGENLYPSYYRKMPKIRFNFDDGPTDSASTPAVGVSSSSSSSSSSSASSGANDANFDEAASETNSLANAGGAAVNSNVCVYYNDDGESCMGTKLMIGDVEVMVPLPGMSVRT
jgi:transcription initiation factor TFIIIB Brf1 subunit/transcription initiation factor TFIIB